MRIKHKRPIHLTYCTNVHAAESWADIRINLMEYLPPLKRRLSPHEPFGVGLRLSAIAAKELKNQGRLEEFKRWLDENGLYVFTLNGFPYGQFHGTQVKDKVYAPDWQTDERTAYTLDLIHILHSLLPDDIDGSISTLPASYKPWFGNQHELALSRTKSAENLASIALHLWEVEQQTGKLIRLGLEPEPDGLVEDTGELIAYFKESIIPAVALAACRQNISAAMAEQIAYRHIGICFDTCHASVQYESPHVSLSMLASSGIAITKVQVSSALKVAWQNSADHQHIMHSLHELGDPVYLHQVREKTPDGRIRRFTDLPDALTNGTRSDGTEWRIHFHVPVFVPAYGALSSTHEDTAECLRLCLAHDCCEHFEIETYTWDVLPPELKTGLTDSIVQEFDWTIQQISL